MRLDKHVDFSRLNILLVDPNRHMRTVIRGVLNAFGIRSVHETADGADAFAEMKHFQPDVIFSELNMDPINGIEFVRMVRQATDTVNRYVPIIMVTSYTESNWVRAARDAGINEFLAKPISAEAIYARLYAVVFRPRDFVHSAQFFGPDRRRVDGSRYKGPERRLPKD